MAGAAVDAPPTDPTAEAGTWERDTTAAEGLPCGVVNTGAGTDGAAGNPALGADGFVGDVGAAAAFGAVAFRMGRPGS